MIFEHTKTSLRARTDEETLSLLTSLKKRVGITRLADLTHLDYTGLPVYTAIRPGATSLTTSQGKGLTKKAAQCSALMESIEVFFAEQLTPEICKKSEIELSQNNDFFIPINHLAKSVRFTDPSQPINWIQAELIFSGRAVFVPFVEYSLNSCLPEVLIYSPDSTGLAGGNNYSEALLHGILEVIERHPPQQVNEVSNIQTDLVKNNLNKFTFFVTSKENIYGIPSFEVLLQAKNPFENQILFKGCGCHLDKKIALNRALTEAIQSRVTTIAGSRDDLSHTKYDFERVQFPTLMSKIDFSNVPHFPIETIEDALSILFEQIKKNNQDILVYRYYEKEFCVLKVKLISVDIINHA